MWERSNSIQNEFRQMGMFTFNGSITGNPMADFLLGDVYQFWQGGGEYKEFRQNRAGFFGQDDFRVTSKLTLNLGLRWDPMTPPQDNLGRVECLQPGGHSTRFPNAPAANRGLSDFDVTHRFVMSYVWALPKLKTSNRILRAGIGGWQTTGILTVQSGFPFTVFAGKDNSLSGDNIDRANLAGNPYLSTDRPDGQLVQEYFNTAAFTQNAPGTFGTSGRNILRGPGMWNLDFGLMKDFAVRERSKLEFRAEAFNVFNRPNFGNPVSTLTSSNFGMITSAGAPRIMQLALQFSF